MNTHSQESFGKLKRNTEKWWQLYWTFWSLFLVLLNIIWKELKLTLTLKTHTRCKLQPKESNDWRRTKKMKNKRCTWEKTQYFNTWELETQDVDCSSVCQRLPPPSVRAAHRLFGKMGLLILIARIASWSWLPGLPGLFSRFLSKWASWSWLPGLPWSSQDCFQNSYQNGPLNPDCLDCLDSQECFQNSYNKVDWKEGRTC